MQTSINDYVIELTERPTNYPVFLGVILFVSFCFIALARLSRPSLIRNLFGSWIKIKHLRAYVKETMPINTRASIFLMLNFVLSGGIIAYLKLGEFEMDFVLRAILAISFPVALFAYGAITLILTGWITGENAVVKEPLLMRFIGMEILGLLFFLCALTWMLNIQFVDYVWILLVVVIGAEFVTRLFKSIVVTYSNGVSWFYIILYLCTLEILPLLIAYYLVMKSFVG